MLKRPAAALTSDISQSYAQHRKSDVADSAESSDAAASAVVAAAAAAEADLRLREADAAVNDAAIELDQLLLAAALAVPPPEPPAGGGPVSQHAAAAADHRLREADAAVNDATNDLDQQLLAAAHAVPRPDGPVSQRAKTDAPRPVPLPDLMRRGCRKCKFSRCKQCKEWARTGHKGFRFDAEGNVVTPDTYQSVTVERS